MTEPFDDETTGGDGDEPRKAAVDVSAKSREVAKRLPVLGYITWLSSHSPAHRQLFVQDLEWRVFPPVILGQYKLQTDSKVGGLPTAYASWAYLSEEAERTYRTTSRLRPDDWRSGERLWLVDFITPFGGAAALLEELYYQIHRNREIRLMYPVDGGEPREVTLSELLRSQSGSEASAGDQDLEGSTRH